MAPPLRSLLALTMMLGVGCAAGDVAEEAATDTTSSAYTIVGPWDVSATQISVGQTSACARLASGEAACWGSNAYGQLGIGSIGGTYVSAVKVTGLVGRVNGIDVGNYQACAASGSSNIVQCWGLNNTLQTGGDSDREPTPVTVSGLSGAGGLALGDYHSCARMGPQGHVHCWGTQRNNRLGDGVYTATETAFPHQVLGVDLANNISSGREQTCVHQAGVNGGEVYCWGLRLESSSTSPGWKWVARPTWQWTLPTWARSVGVGADHGCAALGDGTVHCWGRSDYGQTGIGAEAVLTPRQVSGVGNAAQVVSGDKHSCARTTSGTVRCWGRNDYGQLGAGTVSTWLPPVTVSGLSNVTWIAAHGHTTCAVADGLAYCWGNNANGQVGDGTSGGYRTTPKRVTWPQSNQQVAQ